jgi:hypothetical protein
MNEEDKLYLELGAKDNITPILEKIKKDSEELEEQFSNFKAITIKEIVLKTDGAFDTIRKQIQEGLNTHPFTINVEASPNVDTSKITDAVRTIIEAQERLVNGANVNVGGTTADTSGTSQQNTQAAMENAEAVNQQAKSYEELKAQVDAVLGSIQANTATVVEQKNAISLIDKEMRAINKDVEKSGTMTETQRKRLEMLTASREQHKQALQSSMRILQNDIKLGMAATGSMDELSQSLGRMRKAYRAMTEEQRNGSFGKDLLASIQTADAKIKELDASIGNHQRNVGNYGSAFNGLNMSVQQVVRELPSATMGLQMFFLAISNNLPILADQIKMAKEANKAMKEMGQDTTPVWKQLIKSLFSWQTAMIVGITLLTVYGKEIAAWAKELFTGQRAAISTAEATEKLNEALEKNDGKFSDNAMNVKRLADEWKGLKTEAEQTAWIERNQSAFEQMGLSIRDVTSAERAFVEYTPAVIEALKSRARAEAARELAKEKYKEAFLKREKARQEDEKGVSAWDRMRGSLAMTSNVGVPVPSNGRDQNTIANSLHDERVKSLHDEADTLEEEVNTFYDIAKLEDEKSKAELKRLGLLKEQGKTHKEQLQAQKANLQAQLDVLSESEAAGATGNALRKQIEAVDKRLAAYSLTATNRNNRKGLTDAARAEREAVKAGEAAEKRAGILTRQAVEVERVAKDTELSTRAAEIGAMEESTEKALQQIELDKERKLEAIRREYEDLKLKRIEEAKKLWDADPKNKGVNFYESDSYKTAASDSQYTQAQRDNRAAREREVLASTTRATEKALNDQKRIMYDYLREYGSIQDKRKAINDDYNERIAKANDEWQKAQLRAERDRLLSEANMNELQLSIDWEGVFSDIDTHSVKFLQAIKSQLRAALNSKDITAENAKVLTEKIREIETVIAGKTNVWQAILPGLAERKRLTEQTAAAEADYQKALSEEAEAINQVLATKQAIKAELDKLDIRDSFGQKITVELEAISEENKENLLSSLDKGSDLYNALLKLFENLAADQVNLQSKQQTKGTKRSALDVQWDKLKNMNKLTDVFSWAKGGNPLAIIQGVAQNAQSMSEFVDKIGLADTDFGEAVHDFSDGVNGFNNAIQALASGDVFGAINGVLDGIAGFGKSGINLFAGSGNTEEMEAEIAKLTMANEHLSKSIDSLAETIRNTDSTNSESEAAYKRALAAEKEWEQNQRQAIRDRAGEWSNSGHGFLKLGGKSSFGYYLNNGFGGWNEFNNVLAQNGYKVRVRTADDIWNLTPEQMQLLRDYAPRAWAELLNTDGESNPADLLNAYIERAGKIDELTSALNEKLTGYSWDSFKGSYVDTLKDLTSTTENFADNIEELLTNAILNSLVNEAYKDRIQQLYKMIANAASDESEGGSSFTSVELQRIRGYNEKLANDLVAARDALVQSGAIRETGNKTSSSAGNSIKSVSEQTAGMLASYINAIRATGALNQQSLASIANHIQQEMTPIVQAQLAQLENIARNTAKTADNTAKLDDIYRLLRGVAPDGTAIKIK